MPTLTSGKYNIKWSQLADLPVPLYGLNVAVQDKKVYVTGRNSSIIGVAIGGAGWAIAPPPPTFLEGLSPCTFCIAALIK